MSTYDVSSTNTNRAVKFRIDTAAAAMLGMLKGNSSSYPNYGQLTTAPTGDQQLAQLRTSALVRAVSAYSVPVGIEVDATGQFVDVTFEVSEQGEFFNQAATDGVTVPTHLAIDIVDTLGVGGMTTTKTKPGLQTLATAALTATTGTDGAGTTLFDGATVLAGGVATTLGAVGAVFVTYG
jgi:hypothetical protein